MGYTIFLYEGYKGRGSKRSLHFGTTLAYYLSMKSLIFINNEKTAYLIAFIEDEDLDASRELEGYKLSNVIRGKIEYESDSRIPAEIKNKFVLESIESWIENV